MNAAAYVYVIELTPIGLCKIGSSVDPRDCMNYLLRFHGSAVGQAIGCQQAFMRMTAVLSCRTRAEAYAIERAAHALLDTHRLRDPLGRKRPEWFRVRPRIAMRAVDDAAALWREPELPLALNA